MQSTSDSTYYPRYYTTEFFNTASPGWVYDDYGYLPFYTGFYFGGCNFGYGYHDHRGNYHSWDHDHFADRGNIYSEPINRRPISVGPNVNDRSTIGNLGRNHRGFAPVGTIVNGRPINSDRPGMAGGFGGPRGGGGPRGDVNGGGAVYGPRSNGFVGPVATPNLGPAAGAVNSGFSVGGSTPVGPGLNAGARSGADGGGGRGQR